MSIYCIQTLEVLNGMEFFHHIALHSATLVAKYMSTVYTYVGGPGNVF